MCFSSYICYDGNSHQIFLNENALVKLSFQVIICFYYEMR